MEDLPVRLAFSLTVTVYGALRRYCGANPTRTLEFDSPQSVLEILRHLGIPRDEVAAVSVADALVGDDFIPSSGEQVRLHGLVDGG